MITPDVENFEFSTSLSAESSAACAKTGIGMASTASEAAAAINGKRKAPTDGRRIMLSSMRHLPVRLCVKKESNSQPVRPGRVFHRQNCQSEPKMAPIAHVIPPLAKL